MKRKQSLRLSEDLERAVLCAILSGRADVNVVRPAELSSTGKAVWKAAVSLEKPTVSGVLLHLTEVQGLDKSSASDYLASVQRLGGEENAADVLQAVRDKQLLIGMIDAAQEMLSSSRGAIDLGTLAEYLERDPVSGAHASDSIAERIKDGLPDPPVGLRLRSLPKLYEFTGGLYGSWVIGGEPKLGKTGVAWQVTLDASTTNGIPAIYYDLENSFGVMMDHTRRIYKGDLARIREATSRIYYRDSIRSLENDLRRIPAPALIVVDHIQRLPANVEFRKAGLDRWIHRLDGLKKRGYTVLMISEIGRANYNSDAYIGSFKESGEIEYAAETGIQLLRGAGDCVEVHIVANRHRPYRGLASMLVRYNDWAFKELGEGPGGTID